MIKSENKYFNIWQRLLCVVITLMSFSSMLSVHILHLSFHKGCINEINFIAEQLNCKVTSLFIPDIEPYEWDGYSTGNALYNIGYERALNIWNKHKDYFNQFDAIITSDTAPLSRIFLQNDYKKPLIIWVCNRFDYSDTSSLDCDFPDEDYYQLLRDAESKKNVYIVPYTAFESFYALDKNVIFGDVIIQPTGVCTIEPEGSCIPYDVDRSHTFFIPPYLNDSSARVSQECALLDIATYNGRYNGPHDLKEFKGIIHIPYAWSNLAFFENIQQGLSYFIPSPEFMCDLYRRGIIWWANGNFFEDNYHLSEWYNQENSDVITYFESWQDLKHKIETTDFKALRLKVQKYAEKHLDATIKKWESIFKEIIETKIEKL